MPYFELDGQRLAYTEYGGGPAELTGTGTRGRTARSAARSRPLILLHGLLLSQEMHRSLAEDLAARGNRVITLDLLGHGKSDRPRDMWRYSMRSYGQEVVALMDHLGIEQAVVMGTSLGANTGLEVASADPERLRALVLEMPVLDNGLLGSALAFTPFLVAVTFGEPVMKVVSRLTRAIPRGLVPHYTNVMLDVVRQDPGPSGALMQGLFFGRTAPHRDERRTFTMPALILGHGRDPVHPFSDAGMLAKEMPNARLIEADSLVELRTRPERLTEEIAAFLDEVWSSRRGGRRAAARSGGTGRSSGTTRAPARGSARAAKAPGRRATGSRTSPR